MSALAHKQPSLANGHSYNDFVPRNSVREVGAGARLVARRGVPE